MTMATPPGASKYLGRQERRALKAHILEISPVGVSESAMDGMLAQSGKMALYTAAYAAVTGTTGPSRRDRAWMSNIPAPDIALPPAAEDIAPPPTSRKARKFVRSPVTATPLDTVVVPAPSGGDFDDLDALPPPDASVTVEAVIELDSD